VHSLSRWWSGPNEPHRGCDPRCPPLLVRSSDVNEIFALLPSYAAYSDNSLPTFRGNLSVPSSKVKNPRRFTTIEDGVDRYSRNVRQRVITVRWVTAQKSADLICFAAEAWNHVTLVFVTNDDLLGLYTV